MGFSQLSDSQQKEVIEKNIKKHGCHLVLLEPDGYLPGFAYTIGLYQEFGHPEIICSGLKSELLGALLNDCYDLIRKGQSFVTGTRYNNLIHDYDSQFLNVDLDYFRHYIGYATWYYGSFYFPATQLVWPDKQNYFPWEKGFNAALKFRQPLLDRDMDFKFYEEKNLAVFTSKQVMEGKPILYVYHNEDGDWQFHSEEYPDPADGKIIYLKEITELDRSVNEVYHLNYGEKAWRRSAGEAWEWG